MRDYTYPVVTGMFILGALMILAATTSANAATTQAREPIVTDQPDAKTDRYQPSLQILAMIERETRQQIEVQRATAIYLKAEQGRASAGDTHHPGCATCKYD